MSNWSVNMDPNVVTNLFTTAAVGTAAGFISSVALFVVGAFSQSFRNMEDEKKQLINMGAIVAVVAALFGLSCTQHFSFTSCDIVGVVQSLILIGSTVSANASTFIHTNAIVKNVVYKKLDEVK